MQAGKRANYIQAGRHLRLAAVALIAGVSLYANVQEILPRLDGDGAEFGSRGRGEMHIRLRVDQEAEVTVRGDRVRIRTLSGRWATDAGSTMSAPLPFRNVPIEFAKRDGRGRVWLVQQPSAANRFQLVFRIRDPQGGADRYHVRLRYRNDATGWQRSTSSPAPPPRESYGLSTARHDGNPNHSEWNRSEWNRVSFGRPGSWSRLPGRSLDPRRMERVSDVHGRNGGRFEFRGRVDEEVLFFIRGNQVTAQTRLGRHIETERWSLDEPVPVGRPLRIQVSRRDGRGSVQLLEPPHPGNQYTAVIRVSDPRGGSDRYHFRVDWRY